ncbi:Sulfate/thiosulfate import ATP-binding protein CysA [Planctomycetes bacterium CA13]|uniref:Sulfate/thiosulfate import ATP-binding protein CysA n=1 Tax=Novipirellula herctigrandis TaxID=2527986 RepID=A0A5C5Z6K5_9BACT|nr:Sulfate/thiosulfate import ATP-binding protein CysA [Planctomycetes bacterium CA13]
MNNTLSINCRYQHASGFKLDVVMNATDTVTAICGSSGSGKTTLLSLIAGLAIPESGFICLGDQVLVDTTKSIFVTPERRQIGVLFQENRLFPHLKVKANIEYGNRRRGDDQVCVAKLIKTLEIQHVLGRYPGSLSGGQQQRVALARAIASGPRLLLLDEPLTAVEESLREQISTYIERVVEEFQIPTLLVSHNRLLVEQIAQGVFTIENGFLRADSINSNCYSQPCCC